MAKSKKTSDASTRVEATLLLSKVPPNAEGLCRGELLASALKNANRKELENIGVDEPTLKRYRSYDPQPGARINRSTLNLILGAIGTEKLCAAFDVAVDELKLLTTLRHLESLVAKKTELIILLSQRPLELEVSPDLLNLVVDAMVKGTTMVYWFSPELAHSFMELRSRMRAALGTLQPEGRALFICGPSEASWITIEISCAFRASLEPKLNEHTSGFYRLADKTGLLRRLPDENIERVLRRIVPIYSQLSAAGGVVDGHRLMLSLP